MAVRATGAVTLAAGVLVLAAMAAGFSARVRDAVVLKVLGATTGRILGIYVREYALLGFATALVAALAGTIAAFSVITFVMDLPCASSGHARGHGRRCRHPVRRARPARHLAGACRPRRAGAPGGLVNAPGDKLRDKLRDKPGDKCACDSFLTVR